jgi:DNA-binding MarR family transcriptional regulator
MNALRQIVHALEIGSRAAQKCVGLSGAQLLVLQILEGGGVMSVNELARRSHTHQSSVSTVVSRLVDMGMVSRVAAPDDARRVELSVAAPGRKVLKAGFITPQQRLMAALENIETERVRELRALLEEMVALSGMDSALPPMFFERMGEKPNCRTPKPTATKPKTTKR